jgi:hypothetical protein
MYVNQAVSRVLVVLRSQPPLMPYRRRITIRRQSGWGSLHLPRSCPHGLGGLVARAWSGFEITIHPQLTGYGSVGSAP